MTVDTKSHEERRSVFLREAFSSRSFRQHKITGLASFPGGAGGKAFSPKKLEARIVDPPPVGNGAGFFERKIELDGGYFLPPSDNGRNAMRPCADDGGAVFGDLPSHSKTTRASPPPPYPSRWRDVFSRRCTGWPERWCLPDVLDSRKPRKDNQLCDLGRNQREEMGCSRALQSIWARVSLILQQRVPKKW